jgi:secreted trypsin-like serine protease
LVKKSNGVQIGLVSFGQDCNSRAGSPYRLMTVFTKIADNLDFIEKATNDED